VLRYIPPLRFGDAATPGARNTGAAKHKMTITICKTLLGFLHYPLSINLIEAAILFAAQTQMFPPTLHKKIIAERRTAVTEERQTLIYKSFSFFFEAQRQQQ